MMFITSQRLNPQMVRVGILLVAIVAVFTMVFTPTAQAVPLQTASISKECTNTVLKIGQTGKCVKQAQQALIGKGFMVGPSGADGSFGNNTAAGVLAYQKYFKLITDGV